MLYHFVKVHLFSNFMCWSLDANDSRTGDDSSFWNHCTMKVINCEPRHTYERESIGIWINREESTPSNTTTLDAATPDCNLCVNLFLMWLYLHSLELIHTHTHMCFKNSRRNICCRNIYNRTHSTGRNIHWIKLTSLKSLTISQRWEESSSSKAAPSTCYEYNDTIQLCWFICWVYSALA